MKSFAWINNSFWYFSWVSCITKIWYLSSVACKDKTIINIKVYCIKIQTIYTFKITCFCPV